MEIIKYVQTQHVQKIKALFKAIYPDWIDREKRITNLFVVLTTEDNLAQTQ